MKHNKPHQGSKKAKKKQEECLSFEDWEEIMGMNRDRYEKRRGAWRRKGNG